MFTYAPKRDLRVGYFDGTSAATLEGTRDFQDVLFNEKFIPPEEYDPWVHAKAMCIWANRVGLDGIIRMEPSFEVILCNIDSDLELVSKLEIVYPETMVFPGQPRPFNTSASSSSHENRPRSHPREKLSGPISPGPTVPAYPAPPGWVGKQRNHREADFEAIRAGMWHNRLPGEARIMLDYPGIVSAYDEAYTSLVQSRQGLPRSKHRLDAISASDKACLAAEVEDVLGMSRPSAALNWPAMIQGVLDRYAERLEDLRYTLKRSDLDSITIVAAARQKILIMLTPYMVLPQIQRSNSYTKLTNSESQQLVFDPSSSASQGGPDTDWSTRIYSACAGYATAGILHRGKLTRQEERLARSLDVVQGAICSSIVSIWATAFDSEDKPVLSKHMVAEWRAEIEELMDWLDWHMWIKCDPPCGPGLLCVLATWPWEIRTGNEELGPVCRDYLLDE